MAHQIILKDEVFEELKAHCFKVFDEKRDMSVDELQIELMDNPGVPMHYPYHHFILPAAMLTLAAIETGKSKEDLDILLVVALERSKNVLGGFCGNYGNCGAGVGAGIFMSVYTESSPLSEETWQWCNEITGICLQKIATIPGPRCCKRTGFLSLQAAVPYANEKLGLHLRLNENVHCKYSEKNPQCKKEVCPFYK